MIGLATFSDACVTVTTIALIITPAILVGWWLDTAGARQERRQHRREQRELAAFVRAHYGRVHPTAAQRRMADTVNPSDPSPTPRRNQP